MNVRALLFETLRSGTIASLVMVPFGPLFAALDMRVGHYGKKLVTLTFGELPLPAFRAVLMAEHLVIGWLTTWPLLLAMVWLAGRMPNWVMGLAYGLGYYIVINSLVLPLAFGDPTPWQLGPATILPSLIVHLVFGLSIAITARGFAAKHAKALSFEPHIRPGV